MSKRLRRIYYIPGILSLAIAPILITVRINKYIADRTEHCLEIIVGIKNDNRNLEILFPKRNYQTYILTENREEDSLKLIYIEKLAKKLHLSKDDMIGIKVVLNKETKYKTFISLLNCCLKSGISDWIPLGDTIFIFQKNYPADYNNNLCQNSLKPEMNWGDDCIPPYKAKPRLTLLQKIRNEKEIIKLGIPFAILILFLGYQMIRNIKNEC